MQKFKLKPSLLLLPWLAAVGACNHSLDSRERDIHRDPHDALPLQPNAYSWDGSWDPAPGDFPLEGMLDETHPDLPPGKWGWDNDCNCPGDEGLAIYTNEFQQKGLDFERLEDAEGRHFGWRLLDTDGSGISLNHRGDNFEGSAGADIFDLNPGGDLSGTGPSDRSPGINLGDGPDMLRYSTGVSVDMRTGSEQRGAEQDNDLVILGGEELLGMNEYQISGTTIHTGPGSDMIFARNFGPAAVDLGNGGNGRTDKLDPSDGDDWAVFAGNMRDFRFYGGYGHDVAVWYVDEVLDDRWLGPNFFGGGGWGEALWNDPGIDRLILAVDPETEIVHIRGDHDGNPGSLLSFVYSNYQATVDTPTENDTYARYYGTAPVGPQGEHTVTLSYRSADGNVFTHDFYMTAFEVLQLGTGEDARVYSVNQQTGALSMDSSLQPFTSIPLREDANRIFDSFAR